MLLSTAVATRLEPRTGRAAERNAAQRTALMNASAGEREGTQAEDIVRRGSAGPACRCGLTGLADNTQSPAIPGQDG
jgi:hypothetical protein